jgi:hypothetical protein
VSTSIDTQALSIGQIANELEPLAENRAEKAVLRASLLGTCALEELESLDDLFETRQQAVAERANTPPDFATLLPNSRQDVLQRAFGPLLEDARARDHREALDFSLPQPLREAIRFAHYCERRGFVPGATQNAGTTPYYAPRDNAYFSPTTGEVWRRTPRDLNAGKRDEHGNPLPAEWVLDVRNHGIGGTKLVPEFVGTVTLPGGGGASEIGVYLRGLRDGGRGTLFTRWCQDEELKRCRQWHQGPEGQAHEAKRRGNVDAARAAILALHAEAMEWKTLLETDGTSEARDGYKAAAAAYNEAARAYRRAQSEADDETLAF